MRGLGMLPRHCSISSSAVVSDVAITVRDATMPRPPTQRPLTKIGTTRARPASSRSAIGIRGMSMAARRNGDGAGRPCANARNSRRASVSTIRRLAAVRRLRLQFRRPPDPFDPHRGRSSRSSALPTGSSACSAGFAFAAFYSTLGIPIARLADQRNRVNIIACSIVVWSAFTAVTGLARNFWHLLFARIGVGIGEAGCSPAGIFDHQRLFRAEEARALRCRSTRWACMAAAPSAC